MPEQAIFWGFIIAIGFFGLWFVRNCIIVALYDECVMCGRIERKNRGVSVPCESRYVGAGIWLDRAYYCSTCRKPHLLGGGHG